MWAITNGFTIGALVASVLLLWDPRLRAQEVKPEEKIHVAAEVKVIEDQTQGKTPALRGTQSHPGSQGLQRPQKRKSSVPNRETDGTQALERFESDPVIRSVYQHGGEPLEVDPD